MEIAETSSEAFLLLHFTIQLCNMGIANNAVTPEMDKEMKNKKSIASCFRHCCRIFRNNRGVTNHLRFCNLAPMKDEVGRLPPLAALNKVDNNLNEADDAVAQQEFFSRNIPGNQATEELKECYEKIVFWRKNLFMLPKESMFKDCIKEITKLINEWLIESQIRECTMYALHVVQALLLQKPSKSKRLRSCTKAQVKEMKSGGFCNF